jgi:hypothetical protein
MAADMAERRRQQQAAADMQAMRADMFWRDHMERPKRFIAKLAQVVPDWQRRPATTRAVKFITAMGESPSAWVDAVEGFEVVRDTDTDALSLTVKYGHMTLFFGDDDRINTARCRMVDGSTVRFKGRHFDDTGLDFVAFSCANPEWADATIRDVALSGAYKLYVYTAPRGQL